MKINTENIENDFARRLAEYMNHKGMNQRQLTLKSGLSTGLLNQFFNKGANLGADKIERILNICNDLNPTWWFKGEGNMLTFTYEQLEDKDSMVVREPESKYQNRIKELEDQIRDLESEIRGLLKAIKELGGGSSESFNNVVNQK